MKFRIAHDCDGYYKRHDHYTSIDAWLCGWTQWIVAVIEWIVNQ